MDPSSIVLDRALVCEIGRFGNWSVTTVGNVFIWQQTGVLFSYSGEADLRLRTPTLPYQNLLCKLQPNQHESHGTVVMHHL